MSYHFSGRTGFGAAPSGAQLLGTGGGALGAGASILALSPTTGPLAPFVAAAGAIASVLGAFGVGAGCGQTCVQSSNFANEIEQPLQQNIAAYFALPTPRPKSAQTAALANFDTMWAGLISSQMCGNPQLGSAGQKCISDRRAGACTWKQPAGSVPPWGTPPAGACWNWFAGYRDPIANDTNVYDDSMISGSSRSTAGGSISLPGGISLSNSDVLPLALILGLMAVAVAA